MMKSVATIARIDDGDDFVIVDKMDVDDYDDDDISYDHCEDEWIAYTRSKELSPSNHQDFSLDESKIADIIEEDNASIIWHSDEDRGAVTNTSTCHHVSEKQKYQGNTTLSLYRYAYTYNNYLQCVEKEPQVHNISADDKSPENSDNGNMSSQENTDNGNTSSSSSDEKNKFNRRSHHMNPPPPPIGSVSRISNKKRRTRARRKKRANPLLYAH